MEFLPTVFASGWASGVNAYAVVVLLGLLGRFAGVESVPGALERTDVLVIAAVLYVGEFFADKIPYLDTAWGAIHTAIRPTVGAVIGLLVSGDAATPEQAIAAATGGTTALVSHAIKASLRMAVNTSPEPASNIVVSLAEDFSVAGVVTLAVFHPWVAATLPGGLLLLGVVLAVFLVRRIRRFRKTWQARRAMA